MILLTTFNEHSNIKRFEEYIYVIKENLQNFLFDQIVLFSETCHIKEILLENFSDLEKVKIVYTDSRPKYSSFINYANDYCSGNICTIANGDILFDDSINYLNDIDLSNLVVCLTRYNRTKDGWKIVNKYGSYDSWIYKSPLTISDIDIYLGIKGCDTFFVQKIIENNYNVVNPARKIISKHIHEYDGRNDDLHTSEPYSNYWKHPEYNPSLVRRKLPIS